ncbi:hypothetical protein CC1G_12383 [Coprinopsis cinerea okayama7|uniref:Uncharacterized protein n=1 Tax=Coprinopsis cinerea (strain Okayama-7 / 130 / ATCC MYA-4618 / FGSC 9003) TaxID=240176 RepID=A8NLS3_COPC7|nr:hypothetical protein CC1G_12383 [Coprinopsis cinerea okayama7\|eukprot:XP_001834763.1 hypothetical protein CC1G_12383 [Coprinopsis cinerea okayama7\
MYSLVDPVIRVAFTEDPPFKDVVVVRGVLAEPNQESLEVVEVPLLRFDQSNTEYPAVETVVGATALLKQKNITILDQDGTESDYIVFYQEGGNLPKNLALTERYASSPVAGAVIVMKFSRGLNPRFVHVFEDKGPLQDGGIKALDTVLET